MAWYHLTILRPPGYPHSDCFREVAEGLHHALQALGHRVTFAENRVETEATTIVFGAHLLDESQVTRLPSTTVVYNLEQLGISYTPPWYLSLALQVRIWDYTPANLARWKAVPHRSEPLLLPVGYMPQLSRIPSTQPQDIDVLFYGSMTERRRRVIDRLREAGVCVQSSFGVYGAQRDDLIARSKVVLNLHAAEDGPFEVVRVSYLLANHKAVVSERSGDAGELADAVASCSYEELAEVCLRLVRDEDERHELERRGFAIFSACDQSAMLADVLARQENRHIPAFEKDPSSTV